ncbi:YdeI/OmpD-associated family protein [Paenibacillus planticolens]|uniref:DUF1905 domain-containing protein n=1 Tax=Paenibacillus planticolens TaxID=2654976 RepID=A0ABX1ZNM7_9BACL|nr:YdeI/OmpD-associated family protein [Paenibacillus planticolens]NOV01704.1 DUF1905 domain-containing protein [Paenibacillus planticolens]
MGVTFTAVIEQAANKKATGIVVPAEVIVALEGGRKPSVMVSLQGYTYPSTVGFMAGEFMLPLSAAHREASGLKAGDEVEIKLELETQPRTVEIPNDLKEALSAQEGVFETFEALAFSKRKEFVRQVEDAKTQETRERRISGIVSKLTSPN